MNIMMNSYEDHQEWTTFWSILKNITTLWSSKCSPRFSSKSQWGPRHMAQHHRSPSNGYKCNALFLN